MSDKKTWKSTVWLGDNEEPKVFFSETLNEMRSKVFSWASESEPSYLSNADSNYEITRRYTYARATEAKPLKPGASLFDEEESVITSGWIGVGDSSSWSSYDHFKSIEDLAYHLATSKLKIRKGPDWKEIKIVENKIPLHLIKAVKRIKDEDNLNDHLQSGWYILSIDFEGGMSMDGRLDSKKSEYVVGHTEEH